MYQHTYKIQVYQDVGSQSQTGGFADILVLPAQMQLYVMIQTINYIFMELRNHIIQHFSLNQDLTYMK